MVMQGVGVPKADAERGRQLLTRACDAKDDEACRLLKLASDAAAGDAGVVNALGSNALGSGSNAPGGSSAGLGSASGSDTSQPH